MKGYYLEEKRERTEQSKVALLALPLEYLYSDDKVPDLGCELERALAERLGCDEADELVRDRVRGCWMERLECVGEGEDTRSWWWVSESGWGRRRGWWGRMSGFGWWVSACAAFCRDRR